MPAFGQLCFGNIILNNFKIPLPGERSQIYVRNTAYLYVIKGQTAHKVYDPSLILEIRVTDIAHILIKSDSEFSPPSGCSELYVHVSPVTAFSENIDALFGTETDFDWVGSCG